MDALLSDICISTSAAPTYLPAHYFKTSGALVAIGEVTKQIFKEYPDFFPIKPMDYGGFRFAKLLFDERRICEARSPK